MSLCHVFSKEFWRNSLLKSWQRLIYFDCPKGYFFSRRIWMWSRYFHENLEILSTIKPQKSSLWPENLRKISLKYFRSIYCVLLEKWAGHKKMWISWKMPFLWKFVEIQVRKYFLIFGQSTWFQLWICITLGILFEKTMNFMIFWKIISIFWKSCFIQFIAKIVKIWIWYQKFNASQKSTF